MKRRVIIPEVSAPVELLDFDRDRWRQDGDPSWVSGFRRWKRARRALVAERPDAAQEFGDLLDRFHAEDAAFWAAVAAEPLPSFGAVHVRDRVVTEGVVEPSTGHLRGRLPGEEHLEPGAVGIVPCDWS